MVKCLFRLVLPPLLTKGSFVAPPFRKGRWVGVSRAGGFECCFVNLPCERSIATTIEPSVTTASCHTSLCEREVFVMSASACRVLPSPFCEREVLQEDLINRCLIDLFDRLLQSLIKLFVALLGA